MIRYNTFTYFGSDAPDVVDSGRSQGNIFQNNTISGGLESVKIKEADGTQFINNTFDRARMIRFDDSTETLMSGNTGLDDAVVKVDNDACFDEASDDAYEPTC